jgi:hypothetical protein
MKALLLPLRTDNLLWITAGRARIPAYGKLGRRTAQDDRTDFHLMHRLSP